LTPKWQANVWIEDALRRRSHAFSIQELHLKAASTRGLVCPRDYPEQACELRLRRVSQLD
jgi:hypothetical protein